MLSDLQKRTAQAIINIFETGRVLGDYGNVTVLPGDTGHLTYGRSQTTLASGNLALLLHAYVEAAGRHADALGPYLGAFDRRDTKLDGNEKAKSILREAGRDPIMQRVQDAFFDRVYWTPASSAADGLAIARPLGVSVVYDGHIHGSFGRMRDRTNEQKGTVTELGEEAWITAYVETRREWLANHSNRLLRKTVYRMESFGRLIQEGQWELPLPLSVRNVSITEATLVTGEVAPLVVSASPGAERVLLYRSPLMTGADVKAVQRALDFPAEEVDGAFGRRTRDAVMAFQERASLKPDGKVGPATRAALGIG